MTLRHPASCPQCSSQRVLRIFYGLPTAETWERIRRGDGVAGGCFIFEGQPDWECAACHHRWSDETDPARQELQAYLRKLSGPRPPPDPPPLERSSTGEVSRTWLLQFASVVPLEQGALSQEVSSRAQARLVSEQVRKDADARSLTVHTRRIKPRSVEARIFYPTDGNAAAADSAVLLALEDVLGRITKLQGRDRILWDGWPLPSTRVAGRSEDR
jgi:hypothetical protein